MELQLVIGPNQVLKQIAEPVAAVTVETLEIAKRMLDIMKQHKGAGLAANQVGVLQRIIVIGPIRTKYDTRICINPEVLEQSEELVEDFEGCLSWPDYSARVMRPKQIRVRYTDGMGAERCEFLYDLAARVFLHEVDHLNGINIVDKPRYVPKPGMNKALLTALALGAVAQTKYD